MTPSNDLDCKIFVDAEIGITQLTHKVAGVLSGMVDTLPGSTIHTQYGDIDVLENEFFDEVSREQFPGGFLAFRYLMEFYALPGAPLEKRVAQVAQVLQFFWSQGIPALASCEYDEELPEGGGYGSRNLPWPSFIQ